MEKEHLHIVHVFFLSQIRDKIRQDSNLKFGGSKVILRCVFLTECVCCEGSYLVVYYNCCCYFCILINFRVIHGLYFLLYLSWALKSFKVIYWQSYLLFTLSLAVYCLLLKNVFIEPQFISFILFNLRIYKRNRVTNKEEQKKVCAFVIKSLQFWSFEVLCLYLLPHAMWRPCWRTTFISANHTP